MASDEHWAKRRESLLDPKFGPLMFVPMSDAALLGNGPQLATSASFECLLLGMNVEANILLEFVPRLRAVLKRHDTFVAFAEHRRREAAAYLREYLLVGTWLASGDLERGLATNAYSSLIDLNRWWTRGRFTGANLLHLMLLAIEAGNPEQAASDYLEHEKDPANLSDKRVAKNPRALLYAHLLQRHSTGSRIAATALERFSVAASKWEKDMQPVPYVGQIELARILRACYELSGETPSISDLLAQVRGA